MLLTRPERVIITEGVTDCISLMEHGFPVVSPVTVQIREADWERLLPKLTGVKTVFICQDNEVSDAGMQGALRTASVLAAHGIATRVAVLPLGEKQRAAREKLAGLPDGSAEAEPLLADAKIDVNEFFAGGKTAQDFEAILAAAETPLEMAIAKLDSGTPDEHLEDLLDPILQEVGQMGPIERERHLRLIQSRCGKSKLPVSVLRQQLKVVVLDQNARSKHSRAQAGAAARGGPSSKPVFPKIQINDRQLREIVSDAWLAIHRANQHGGTIYPHTPFLFHRAGRLVRLVVGEFGPEIHEMDEDAVFGLLARTADWQSEDGILVHFVDLGAEFADDQPDETPGAMKQERGVRIDGAAVLVGAMDGEPCIGDDLPQLAIIDLDFGKNRFAAGLAARRRACLGARMLAARLLSSTTTFNCWRRTLTGSLDFPQRPCISRRWRSRSIGPSARLLEESDREDPPGARLACRNQVSRSPFPAAFQLRRGSLQNPARSYRRQRTR